MNAPDPDAVMVMAVLNASDQPMTTDLLLSAARAYEALRSSRDRAAHLSAEGPARRSAVGGSPTTPTTEGNPR